MSSTAPPPPDDRAGTAGSDAHVRKSSLFLAAILFQIALLGLCLLHADSTTEAAQPALRRMALTVKALGLTDLCLFTDAAYTRHLALADGHAPFQEHPVCLEHFPAGSLAGPPQAHRR